MGRLLRLVREWNIDVIHAHLPLTGIMARATGLPVVYTEHNLAESYRQPTRSLNRATYGRNAAVIAVSEPVARSLDGFRGPIPQVIPNGVTVTVEETAAAEARGELALDAVQPLVVHIGNIRPHKGHATLVAAAGELLRARPDVTVVSIGGEKHAGDLDRVHADAARLGLGDGLRFLGRRSDALSFVAAADVYVNPADVEGLPVSILEALALGIPVVATAVGGVPAVVRHGETGLLVQPREPHALAEGIQRLLEDRGLAARLAAAGRTLVEREYGLEPMVRSVEKIYEQVLGG
jgi:glycosyltransferase involved in cell wall biosynthesis